jgi:hypothetical protein
LRQFENVLFAIDNRQCTIGIPFPDIAGTKESVTVVKQTTMPKTMSMVIKQCKNNEYGDKNNAKTMNMVIKTMQKQ